jgi:2-polyprenyl-3-methyl-5-hydroxy-6-metoxy-1,4-benzoquinol methylase
MANIDSQSTNQNHRDKFRDIYLNREWTTSSQARSASGPGSDLQNAQEYVDLIQQIIISPEYQIKSVVDVGCGDWGLSKHIDWSNVSYTGIDIVPEIVTSLQSQYGSDNVTFKQGNLMFDELPSADLLIVKDVLQHLPNQAVSLLIATQLKKYRFAIITNDRERIQYLLYPLKYLQKRIGEANIDIPAGEWRPLNLRDSPFDFTATEILTFPCQLSRRTFDIKEVLFWTSGE